MSEMGKVPGHTKQQDTIQDYLDLLLTQATEGEQAIAAVAPVSAAPELSTPGVSGPRPAVALPPQTPAQPALVQVPSARPFAEPAKPLILKVAPEALKLQPVPELETKSKPKPKPAAAIDIEAGLAPVSEPVIEHTPPALGGWLANGRPHWAQQRFECLLFCVGGLKLAVPLVELGTIYQMSDELTPLFGQIDWFMGLLTVKGRNIRTVNTAQVVMPERYRDDMIAKFRFVISIDGVDWGLAVDSVADAISLGPEDVRWRSERSKRPWLAGTVVEQMCALVDVSQLAQMFSREDDGGGA